VFDTEKKLKNLLPFFTKIMADSSDTFFNNFSSNPPPQLNTTKKQSYYAAPSGTTTTSTGYYGTSSEQQVPGASSSSYYGNGVNDTTTTTTTTTNTPYSTPTPAATNFGAYGGATSSSTTAATTTPQVMNPYVLNSTGDTAATNTTMQQQQQDTTTGLSGAMNSNNALSGPMDSNYSQQQQQPLQSIQPTTFIPQVGNSNIPTSPTSGGYGGKPYDPTEFENELPLLEELGINVEHIVQKMRNVVLPLERFGGKNMDATVIQDADLSGPIALGLILGGELLLTDGKLSFGYIYGIFLFGCVSMTFILNFMSPQDAISFWTVTSILGYSLLPVNLLAAIKLIVVKLGNFTSLGRVLAFLTVLWCTVASTRLMEQGCDMRNQRYLIAYPIALLYTAVVLITIF